MCGDLVYSDHSLPTQGWGARTCSTPRRRAAPLPLLATEPACRSSHPLAQQWPGGGSLQKQAGGALLRARASRGVSSQMFTSAVGGRWGGAEAASKGISHPCWSYWYFFLIKLSLPRLSSAIISSHWVVGSGQNKTTDVTIRIERDKHFIENDELLPWAVFPSPRSRGRGREHWLCAERPLGDALGWVGCWGTRVSLPQGSASQSQALQHRDLQNLFPLRHLDTQPSGGLAEA